MFSISFVVVNFRFTFVNELLKACDRYIGLLLLLLRYGFSTNERKYSLNALAIACGLLGC
jgi:hypothetical protein